MKRGITEVFRDSTTDEVSTTAKYFLDTLEKRFARNEKAESVQEEERLKQDRTESAHFTMTLR